VVLPAPLAPTKPIRSPRATRKEISLKSILGPYRLLMLDRMSMKQRANRFAGMKNLAKQMEILTTPDLIKFKH
jgi:hypothetical protein